jgi:hypothetical protein
MSINDLVSTETLRGEVKWYVKLDYYGSEYLAAWVLYYSVADGHELGYWFMTYKNGEELSNFNDEGKMILNAARSLRESEVRSQYDTNKLHDAEYLSDTVLDLFNRHLNGEFIGQTSGSLYTQNIAWILNISESSAINVVDMLRREKKIGLTGLILIPFEQDEGNRKYLESISGHKDFDRSDFGDWWSCRACGSMGDWEDGNKPSDFPCVD